jgi:hypothetical protein
LFGFSGINGSFLFMKWERWRRSFKNGAERYRKNDKGNERTEYRTGDQTGGRADFVQTCKPECYINKHRDKGDDQQAAGGNNGPADIPHQRIAECPGKEGKVDSGTSRTNPEWFAGNVQIPPVELMADPVKSFVQGASPCARTPAGMNQQRRRKNQHAPGECAGQENEICEQWF